MSLTYIKNKTGQNDETLWYTRLEFQPVKNIDHLSLLFAFCSRKSHLVY